MNQIIQVFLPTHYLPKEDKQLKANVQMISTNRQKGDLSGHALAVAYAVYTIACAIFINIPYYLAEGSINLVLNCVCLHFDRMVLGHYKAALQSLIYAALATIYVAIGAFIPPVLNGFKMQASKVPFHHTESQDRNQQSSEESSDDQSLILRNLNNTQVGPCNREENLASIAMGLESITSLNGWEIPNAQSVEINSVGIQARDMIGNYGVNLERQAYRTALEEYARILHHDFGIDLDKQIIAIKEWLKNPSYKDNSMIQHLYNTLVYLKNPIAYYTDKRPVYNHAKEQYETYVDSLHRVIAELQKIRQESKCKVIATDVTKELKECFILIDALCEARFRPENHGLLRSLLQLHKEEYARLHPEAKPIPDVTKQNFAEVVVATNKNVSGAPVQMRVSSVQKANRQLFGGIGYENFLRVDIPFLRQKQFFTNDQGERRVFYYIRHPTPHISGSIREIVGGAMLRLSQLGNMPSGETIDPEFEEMLEAIAKRDESYFIQSHQRLNDSGLVENENSRSQTLYHLQKSHENFHVVFQAVEGELFNREGPYAKITTFADLKRAIKDSFYQEGSPNRLPALLEKDEQYRNEVIDDLLNQVHQTVFGGRTHISFEGQNPTEPEEAYPNREWQAFILAFYIFQGDDLKFRLPNVKYFCTNCKNFFDRGGNRAMAEDRMHQEMSEQEVTREQLEEIIVNLIPVPLQSKGIGVLLKRLLSGLALADILANLSLEQKQALEKVRFSGYKFDRCEVSKRPQRATPLIENARTLQEMQEFLKALQGKCRLLKDNAIVEKNYAPYRKNQVRLFDQVNKDLLRSKIYVDKTHYDGQVENLETKNAQSIFKYLTNKGGLSEELAYKVMAQIQQGVFFEPCAGLTEAFRHVELGLMVADDPEKKATIRVTTTEGYVEIKVKNYLRYRTSYTEKPYYRNSPIATFRTEVLITIPKDGSDSNAHWTWEIVDVSA